MKTIFYRLILILSLFYILLLFSFYIFFIKKSKIYLNDSIYFILISFVFYTFTIYLLYRTSNYIVNPIKYILSNFKKFPKFDKEFYNNSKIIEIQQLNKIVQSFLEKYAKYLEELNLEKNLLNSLLNNLKEGVLSIDQNGIIIYINEFIKSRFCFNDNDLKNKYYYEAIKNPTLLDIIYKILYKKNIQYIFSGSRQENNVFELIDKDKYYQIKFYEINIEAFTDEYEQNRFEKLFLFIINDITEEYNTKRIREDFLQNASHELKTPITSIRGYTETILDKIQDAYIKQNHLLIQFLEGILRNTERMERIINDMVLISSIESKSYPIHPTELQLTEFLEQLKPLVEGILKPKNLYLNIKILGNLPSIYADPLLLEHLFLNLISNAARYSKENKPIEIILEKINVGKISISIVDYGPGIPNEYKEKIFERFFRIDKDRSRKEGGTGLGLSIVRQIVRIHHGSVFVKDNPEGGAIFVVHLPI